MQDRHLFEYAVVRVVPRVEREEFMNIGVIVFCAKLKFMQVLFTINEGRLQCFTQQCDVEEIKEHLQAFENICLGNKQGGPIALLDAASRFRWLTATRSTVVQCSKVHPGLCTDPAETLVRLHNQLVM